MGLRPVVLIALAFGLALPATAGAARPATPEEFNAASMSNDVAGIGLEGVEMTVSTVDASWGSLVATKRDLSELGRDVAVVRWDGRSWGIISVVDPEDPVEFCGDIRVPVGAGVDLGVCKAPPALPLVLSLGPARSRPKEMGQGAHGYYKRLKWSRWSANVATGRGVFDYADRYDRIRAPVKIKLYRPQRCRSGVVLFTRQAIVPVRRADRKRLRFATDARSLPGCAAMYQDE